MKYRLLIGLIFLIFLSLTTAVRADTIYTYTGKPFSSFGGSYSCPPQCGITGSFRVAQPNSTIPLSYDFTDGFTHWTNSNSVADYSSRPWAFPVNVLNCRFYCWFISLTQPNDQSYPRRSLISFDGGADYSWLQASPTSRTDFAWNYDLSGTWSSVIVQEPSSLSLLVAGLLGAGALFLRR